MNMNKIKRTCALLLAVALILGVVIQSGIGGVLANNMDGTTEQTGTVSEQSEPVSEPVTMPVTEQITEQITEDVTEPVTEPITEPVTEPAEEAVTEPAAAPDDETQTAEPTADSDVTGEDGGDILPELSIYQQLMSCQSLAEMEVLLFSEENAVAVAMLTQEERGLISSRIEELAMLTGADDILKNKLLAKLNENTVMICPECGGIDGLHAEGCSAYVQVCICGSLDGTHTEDCPAYLPVCTCGSLDGVHTEDCQLYVPICNCGSENGEHDETCPLYVPDATICDECGVDGGHDKTCSQYVEEYVWAGFTDWELAIWLMDEANAETVKAILSDETTEEYALLTLRIDAIMNGEDTVLAEQVIAYLTALMGMDGTNELADEQDEYIYFDLAAGSVTIGKTTYTGWVYVGGVLTKVTGTHEAKNKYYIYQSTEENRMSTGYADETAYINKTGCRVPVYQRVMYEGKPWTEYITNNTDVKAVSEAWETAAIAAGRTAVGKQAGATGNYIIFTANSKYTADVTIDNIWTYFQKPGPSRSEGGIAAHFVANIDVNITIRLKCDNRLGNIHYGANRGTNNQIIFCNGDESDAPGSLTVADFPNNFGGNYWCSAIGGDDSKCDRSDGIVINSGVIYAGTTSEDDCTAIGGGGNEYGGVTINGGTVTAVSASTGTAIGGGIGWGNQGGDARVVINGGTVYAYNHGIGPDSGSYVSFVPAAAIGGGSASTNTGNKDTYVEINGGFVYAQSKGGVAIGGGGSGTQTGGKATVNISGGTVIAKSVGGEVNYDKKGVGKNHTETITPGVSIGGGTGATGGGSVKLTISGENTILRTDSIGGGKTTGSGNIGSANVTITGGDITGQVIMAGGASSNCSFTMSGGRIHDTDVVNGNTITDTNIVDPQKDVKISYIEKNGGAVWMEDPKGVTEISGGTIEGCTAELGGAIYMTGGKFTLSGTGNISGNKATAETTSTDPETPAADTSVKGLGGAVYISNGTVDITGGIMGKDGKPNRAVNGAGVYVNDGTVNVSGGNIQFNSASINGGGLYVTGGNVNVSGGKIDKNTAGERGGGVYLAVGGSFTMEGKDAVISNNNAENGGGIYLYTSPILQEGSITENIATKNGGGMYIYDCLVELSPKGDVYITNNSAVDGAGIYIHEKTAADATGGETVGETGGETGGETSGETEADPDPDTTVTYDAISNATPGHKVGLRLSDKTEGHFYFIGNKATKSGGAVCIDIGRFYLDTDNVTITNNRAENGGGVAVLSGNFTMSAGSIGQENGANTATNGGGVYVSSGEAYLRGGRVEYNEADYGGGVYVDAGDATIVGGRVEYNTAVNDGGGVYVRGEDEKGELKMESGTLSSNIANNDGGGFYVDNGNFIMGGSSGSDPSGNASGDGDGETPGTTSPEAIISGNIANAHGGGGYVAGDFLMLNGTIGGAGGTNQANSGGESMLVTAM